MSLTRRGLLLAAGAVALGLRVVSPSGAARAFATKTQETADREAKRNGFIGGGGGGG